MARARNSSVGINCQQPKSGPGLHICRYPGLYNVRLSMRPSQWLSWKMLKSNRLAKANEIRNCHDCKQVLIKAFLMPSLWWTDHLRKSNGYFGCEVTRDGEKITGLSKCLFTHEQWQS